MKGLWKILAIVLLAALLPALSGCSDVRRIKDIKVTSVGVKYVVPTSMKSAKGVLVLGIYNPAMSFTVSDVSGAVRKGDHILGYFSAGEISLEGHTEKKYELPCTAELADNVSVVEIIKLVSNKSYEGLAADIEFRFTLPNGIGKSLVFKDLDIEKILTE